MFLETNLLVISPSDFYLMQQTVIMADIIDSRGSNQAATMLEFKSLTNLANYDHSDSILSPLTITLGDEFQGVARSLATGIELIIALEELAIKRNIAFKLRYALVQGDIDTPLNSDIAYGMLGSGLTRAREALVDMKKENARFYVEVDDSQQQEALNSAFILYQNLVDNWKPAKDYTLVAHFLHSPDYKEVAREVDKSRSQIWKRYRSLDMHQYFAIKRLLAYLSQL